MMSLSRHNTIEYLNQHILFSWGFPFAFLWGDYWVIKRNHGEPGLEREEEWIIFVLWICLVKINSSLKSSEASFLNAKSGTLECDWIYHCFNYESGHILRAFDFYEKV